MKMIRRAILAFALALTCGLAPAIAQIPPPIPALPDAPRITSYSISASNCACAVGFQIYGDSTDYANWIEVWINGVQISASQWTITSPTGSIATIPRPITDAVLTFSTVQTGTVQIVGARRPRRTSQFQESQPVPTRNFNQVFSDIIAMLRETWDKIADVGGRVPRAPPGETMTMLPPAANRANMNVCFDNLGNMVPCVPISGGSFSAGSGINFTGTNPTVISTVSVANPIVQPQGRLTLVSGLPVMSASQAAATRVYYTPYAGNSTPIYDGANLNPVAFPEVFQDTTDTSKSPAAVAPSSCYDMFAWLDSITPRVTRGPAWTTANPGVRSAGTALSQVNGIFLNSISITNGPAASRGTYVGTICSNALSTIDYIFGSTAPGGGPASFGIWNINPSIVSTTVLNSTASWTRTTNPGAWQSTDLGADDLTARISGVRGLNIDGVSVKCFGAMSVSGGGNSAYGCGLNSTSTPSGVQQFNVSGATAANLQGQYDGLPGIGYVTFNVIEFQSTVGAATYLGNSQNGLTGTLRQ